MSTIFYLHMIGAIYTVAYCQSVEPTEKLWQFVLGLFICCFGWPGVLGVMHARYLRK